MTQRTFSLVTAVLFSLIALLHAVRLLRGWQVTVEGAVMPVWISWIGLAIAAYLAYQGFLLSKNADEIDSVHPTGGFIFREGLLSFLASMPVETSPLHS